MRCIRVHRARRCLQRAATMLAFGAAFTEAKAQTYPPQSYPYPQQYPPQYPYPQSPLPATQNGQAAPLPAYHGPTIIVAAPADGTPLPEDKPVAVLRFMSVEPTDPIDALSFSVTVDGKDKTSLFQATQGEAWGPLAAPNEMLASGQHNLAARICTSHGECSIAKTTVTVIASASELLTAAKAAEVKQKKTKILDAVLQAARVLFR